MRKIRDSNGFLFTDEQCTQGGNVLRRALCTHTHRVRFDSVQLNTSLRGGKKNPLLFLKPLGGVTNTSPRCSTQADGVSQLGRPTPQCIFSTDLLRIEKCAQRDIIRRVCVYFCVFVCFCLFLLVPTHFYSFVCSLPVPRRRPAYLGAGGSPATFYAGCSSSQN